MPEKPPSIVCETCGGWHPAETHAQYEKEAREKRMAEIKARPDSAYRFDTLGFSSEQKGEIEPWMHEVIEKAKDLGDDLQDADLYIHIGPLEQGEEPPVPSVLSMITQTSFVPELNIKSKKGHSVTEGPTYVSHHRAGESMQRKGHWGHEIPTEILEIQERWVKTRDVQDLDEYKKAIENELDKFIKRTRYDLSDKSYLNPIRDNPEAQKRLENRIVHIQELINNLDSVSGRKAGLYFIEKMSHRRAGGTGESVGIIFTVGDALFSDPKFYFQSEGGTGGSRDRNAFYRETIGGLGYNDKWVIIFSPHVSDLQLGINPENQTAYSPYPEDEESKYFYKKFIHAVWVPHGSIEGQRKVLEHMLEMTKDKPEQRLPIYNFYGKLVWPQPPKK